MTRALTYAADNFDRFVQELSAFLRIPSISTDPTYKKEVLRAAEWLVQQFQDIGMQRAELFPTQGHPIVYAEHIEDPQLPTILVYGHYDVQPPDPLELWESPPFEPVIKNGVIYARGASDDKGQVFMHVKAAEAYLKGEGKLPVNLKFLIEGEEESGSENLVPFIQAHQDMLQADTVLISDTAMLGPDLPSITYALRGIAYTEIEITGPDHDLHSGVYGGAVDNPVHILSRLIAGLHDEDHRITIPGFYEKVRELSEEERQMLRALPFDEKAWMESIGVRAVRTESGYTILEATTARPSLDVNGIWGGYQGEGAKTVIPSKAGAKISMRLVADQDPEDIALKTRRYFEEHMPETVSSYTFRYIHGGYPVTVDIHSPPMQAAAKALEAVFKRTPYFTREGGSIPVVADFKRLLGLDSVLMGFGLNSDAIHSPNEHFDLERFRKGIESSIHFQTFFPQEMH